MRFLLPKCEFFNQCCLINVFITRTYSYEFSKTVLVKKNTPCQGMIFYFYFPNAVMFILALQWNLINTHLDVFFFIIELLLGIIYFVTLFTTISSTYFAMLEHLKARKLDI